MHVHTIEPTSAKPLHAWLRTISITYMPGPGAAAVAETAQGILRHFALHGHRVQETPDESTDIILTTAQFGEPLGWREAPLFYARRQFDLKRTPTIYTLVHVTPAQFHEQLARFATILQKEPPDPADYDFPGLSPDAYRVLFEQGRRGGPILSFERLVQAQAKSIRILLVVGDAQPHAVYHFDLVGAYPKSELTTPEEFFDDIVLRIATTMSTREITEHAPVGAIIPRAEWLRLSTPAAMSHAGRELGKRNFFTEMVVISKLVQVPAVTDGVASQYSEGCFATWEPQLPALVATVTGSARPVDKGNITENDLAVIVGVRAGGRGAEVRSVEKERNDPPSSEAVEMMDMDTTLPYITLATPTPVPVVRSKLHGHRGVAAYHPKYVEYVPLDPPFYHYLVSCATEAQARGIKAAFARAESLLNPADPRQVAFTVLPGHGAVIVEKWAAGKAPFQTIWEYMDAGYLQIESRVPQGPMEFVAADDGRRVLQTDPVID